MRRATTDLTPRVDALDEAVALAAGRLDPEVVERAAAAVARVRARVGHGTDLTVAALAGTTGSGKSSLCNALAQTEVSPPGVTRPTTGVTHGVTFGAIDSGALLDWLEVPRRFHTDVDGLEGLVLLDLPDLDSINMDNRIEMGRLVDQVDLVIWVTDPQKYGDATVHRALSDLKDHDDVTIVVLNQIDRLAPDARPDCLTDLSRLVAADGLPDARVVGASAVAPDGTTELVASLADAVTSRKAAVRRLELEIDDTAAELTDHLGLGAAAGVDRAGRNRLISAMSDAAGMAIVTDAVAAGHRRDAQQATGWPVTRWLSKTKAHPLRRLGLDRGGAGRTALPGATPAQASRLQGAVRTTADEASAGLGANWPGMVREAPAPAADLADALDQAAAGATAQVVSKSPRWWTAVGALQWVLAGAMVAGLVWLTVLFALEWFQIPDPPTPEVRGWPLPTLLALGGCISGLVVAWIARLVAGVGAKRQAKKVRAQLETRVAEVADTQVIAPIESELEMAGRLETALSAARGPEPRRYRRNR